ncbi:hypothetical protein G7Y89_g11883 [Cudoniella acicularis]|uniref:Fungal lipase-type domain-containing protein n=1 Tax=Cudoniella acicularis TaxID=354080 RepID=A0A8H4VXH0_9HELO|nr:hypothetical protein G7Y89_g11883 [Cudoniella acicularis]
MNLYSQYSAAAYCPFNTANTTTHQPILCPTGSCPLLSFLSHSPYVHGSFLNRDPSFGTAFLAISPHDKTLILSFCGSEFTAASTSAREEFPDYTLAVTGHSLGAAQTAFATAEFRANGTKGEEVWMFDYAQPHLGDLNLADVEVSIVGRGV